MPAVKTGDLFRCKPDPLFEVVPVKHDGGRPAVIQQSAFTIFFKSALLQHPAGGMVAYTNARAKAVSMVATALPDAS